MRKLISNELRRYWKKAVLITAAIAITGTAFPQAAQFIKKGRSLPQPRGFHGSAVMGDYLYVVSGSVDTPDPTAELGRAQSETQSVLKAQILQGGDLGPWQETTPLPIALHYISNSTIALNDVVYVIGGSTLPLNGEYQNTAFWSKPLSDGTLMPWRKSREFGTSLSTITAVTTPGHIHVIGGRKRGAGEGNASSSEVWSNQIFTDGSMSSWERGPSLPLGLWFHHAGVAANRVYVWAGLADEEPTVQNTSPLIFSAPILGNGKIGNWRQENKRLSTGFYSASSAVAGPYLISFSPRYPIMLEGGSPTYSGDVWWTYITPQGMIDWTREPTPIPNRVYHSVTPDYRRGTIYVIGGRPDRGSGFTDNVAYFTLSPQARRAAEDQWAASQRAHANSVATFETLASSTGGEQGADRLSYLADRRLAEGAVLGFQTIDDARRDSTRRGEEKPLIMYFNIETAQPCIDQKEILEQPGFQDLATRASFAWINTRENPQLAQQTGVFRVPTWVFYDKGGNEIQRVANIAQLDQLKAMVDQLD